MKNFGHKVKETYVEEVVTSCHHELVNVVALEMHTCSVEISDMMFEQVRVICDVWMRGTCDVWMRGTCDAVKEVTYVVAEGSVIGDAEQVRVICDDEQVRVISGVDRVIYGLEKVRVICGVGKKGVTCDVQEIVIYADRENVLDAIQETEICAVNLILILAWNKVIFLLGRVIPQVNAS